MFAYCNNNPIMSYDTTGTKGFECCSHGDCRYCREKKNTTSSVTTSPVPSNINHGEVDYGFTYSNGLSGSVNVGFFAFSGQGGVSVDAQGNVGIQITLSCSLNASIIGSDYGASIGSYNTFTNAGDIYKLEKESHQLGIGATAPIPYTKMNGSVESNFVMIPIPDSDRCYVGYSDFKGIYTLGSADFNAHYTGGYTFDTIWDFNIFKLFGG